MDRKRDGEVCESLRNWAEFNRQGISQAWDRVAEALGTAEGQKPQHQSQQHGEEKQQQGEETQLVPLASVNS